MHVIDTSDFSDEVSRRGTAMRWWVGPDERGRELEIGAVRGAWPDDDEDLWIVIHVFPTALRDKEGE